MNIEECYICNDNKTSDNLHCYKCNKTICIQCCNKLNNKSYIHYEIRNEIFVKYKCPYCREYNNKNLKLFNKCEGVSFFANLLTEYLKLQNNNDNYIKLIESLKKDNANLNNELDKKNIAMKKVIDINSNNVEAFNKILNQYKKFI